MSRKRCNRRKVVPMPPPGLRPKLKAAAVQYIGIAHMQNLALVADGKATGVLLWDLVRNTLTWHKTATMLGVGIPEMTEQLAVTMRVLERFERTGKVGFNGPDYQLAKKGVMVMDQLSEIVDIYTADAATRWADAEVERIAELSRQPIDAANAMEGA